MTWFTLCRALPGRYRVRPSRLEIVPLLSFNLARVYEPESLSFGRVGLSCPERANLVCVSVGVIV